MTRPRRLPLFGRDLGKILLETNGIVADYLVDTDVFVDHFRGAQRFVPQSHRVHYSVITRAEQFAGSTASDAVRVGRPRRETGIRLPDALIAATAVENKLSLFTRNRSDFEKVGGLRTREI